MLTWLTSSIDSRPLGLARILVGLAALIRSLVALRILTELTDPDVLRTPYAEWMPAPTMPLVVVVISVWIVSAALFTVGWRVPLTGPVLLAAIVATLSLDQQAYSNHLYLMAWLVLLMTVADAGAGMAFKSTERPVVRWPVLLLMTQASVVYGFSALTKMNDSFLSGGVLAGVLSGGVVPFPDTLRTPGFLSSLAGLVILVELAIATFIWLTNFRPAALVLGLGLHLAITLLMAPTAELVVFSLEMLALYPLFLAREKLVVIYDDDCSSCTQWAHRFERLDLLRTVTTIGKSDPTNQLAHRDVEEALHLIHHGTTTSGFAAVTRVLEHLVPTLWLAPILRLPGISHLAERWYRWQAERRSCRVGEVTGAGA